MPEEITTTVTPKLPLDALGGPEQGARVPLGLQGGEPVCPPSARGGGGWCPRRGRKGLQTNKSQIGSRNQAQPVTDKEASHLHAPLHPNSQEGGGQCASTPWTPRHGPGCKAGGSNRCTGARAVALPRVPAAQDAAIPAVRPAEPWACSTRAAPPVRVRARGRGLRYGRAARVPQAGDGAGAGSRCARVSGPRGSRRVRPAAAPVPVPAAPGARRLPGARVPAARGPREAQEWRRRWRRPGAGMLRRARARRPARGEQAPPQARLLRAGSLPSSLRPYPARLTPILHPSLLSLATQCTLNPVPSFLSPSSAISPSPLLFSPLPLLPPCVPPSILPPPAQPSLHLPSCTPLSTSTLAPSLHSLPPLPLV